MVARKLGCRDVAFEPFFEQSGGAFDHEFLSGGIDGGVGKGATPEFDGCGEFLLHQHAPLPLVLRRGRLGGSTDVWLGFF